MSNEKYHAPVPVHQRLAACIKLEAGLIDFQILVDGAEEIIQSNIAVEDLSQRQLAHKTVITLGPHIRTTQTISAWEKYNNETY